MFIMPELCPMIISITTITTISFCATICTTFGLDSFDSMFGYRSVTGPQASLSVDIMTRKMVSNKLSSMSENSLVASKGSPFPPNNLSSIGNAIEGFISKTPLPSRGFIEKTLKLVGFGKDIRNSPYVIWSTECSCISTIERMIAEICEDSERAILSWIPRNARSCSLETRFGRLKSYNVIWRCEKISSSALSSKISSPSSTTSSRASISSCESISAILCSYTLFNFFDHRFVYLRYS